MTHAGKRAETQREGEDRGRLWTPIPLHASDEILRTTESQIVLVFRSRFEARFTFS